MDTRLSKQMQILEGTKHDKKGRTPILPSKFLNEVVTRSVFVIDGDFMNGDNREIIFFPMSPQWILAYFSIGCKKVMNKKPGLRFKIYGKKEEGGFEAFYILKTIDDLDDTRQVMAGVFGNFYPIEALDDTLYSLVKKNAITKGGADLELFEKYKDHSLWYWGVEKFAHDDNHYDGEKLIGYVDFITNSTSTSSKTNIFD